MLTRNEMSRHVHIGFRTCEGIYTRTKKNSSPLNQYRQNHPKSLDDNEKEE
jgi:hypothetical protein